MVQVSTGGIYEVVLEDGSVVEASLRGRVKRQERTGDRVVIGDRVGVEGDGATWTIEQVDPRDHEIVRRGPGGRGAKVVAANVDRLVAVFAAGEPEPRIELADRLLVTAEANGLEGVLVLNKVDLPGAAAVAEPFIRIYGAIGYRVVGVSARAAIGVEALREILCSGTSALVGPSGVGKSSLLNTLEPGLQLRTGELSRKRPTGRHTTVTGRLLRLGCGGRVADTPGFSDMGMWGLDVSILDRSFPEFRPLLDGCRFSGCSHVHEPDCAVKDALAEGRIAPSRYASYVNLRREAEQTR